MHVRSRRQFERFRHPRIRTVILGGGSAPRQYEAQFAAVLSTRARSTPARHLFRVESSQAIPTHPGAIGLDLPETRAQSSRKGPSRYWSGFEATQARADIQEPVLPESAAGRLYRPACLAMSSTA